MILFGAYNIPKGNIGLSAIVFATALCLVFGVRHLFKYPHGKITYRLFGAVYLTLLLIAFIVGGEGGSKSLWVFSFPVFTIFLMGNKEGLVWALSIILLITGLYIYSLPVVQVYPYSGEFIIRFITTYLIVCIVTYWLELYRDNYYRKMQEGDRRFNEILEHSRDILYMKDINIGEYNYISEAFCRNLGYSESSIEEVQKSGFRELIHPDDIEKYSLAFKRIKNGYKEGAKSIVEYRLKHNDGKYYWYSDQLSMIPNANGEPDFIIGSKRDITEAYQHKLELKVVKDQLVTILNSIDAAVYVADIKTYELIFLNKYAEHLFGNVVGEKCWKVLQDNQNTPCDFCTNKYLVTEQGEIKGIYQWEFQNTKTKHWYDVLDYHPLLPELCL